MCIRDRYNTLIGEKGIRLSGGQKQRLAIARALLTNPKFIIFDEATSALNYELEQKINNNIATNFSDVTFVHITHRLSSLVSCDRIVVINEGEIVGDGKFGDLLENNQSFIQLYNCLLYTSQIDSTIAKQEGLGCLVNLKI